MKLLATDMDGTFLRDDKSYSEEFNDLYKQMLKQDIQFVIASGNQYEALACKFDEEIKNDLYYLCENGTKIVYQGKTLYKKALEKQDAQEVLDILKEEDVVATFFVVGKHVKENPELVKRAYDEGHFIANHGYNHNNSKLYKNDDSFINEIKNTDIEIGNAIRCFKLLLTCI